MPSTHLLELQDRDYGFCHHHKTPISFWMYYEKCRHFKCRHRTPSEYKVTRGGRNKNGIPVLIVKNKRR
jgi:hypothetical protein